MKILHYPNGVIYKPLGQSFANYSVRQDLSQDFLNKKGLAYLTVTENAFDGLIQPKVENGVIVEGYVEPVLTIKQKSAQWLSNAKAFGNSLVEEFEVITLIWDLDQATTNALNQSFNKAKSNLLDGFIPSALVAVQALSTDPLYFTDTLKNIYVNKIQDWLTNNPKPVEPSNLRMAREEFITEFLIEEQDKDFKNPIFSDTIINWNRPFRRFLAFLISLYQTLIWCRANWKIKKPKTWKWKWQKYHHYIVIMPGWRLIESVASGTIITALGKDQIRNYLKRNRYGLGSSFEILDWDKDHYYDIISKVINTDYDDSSVKWHTVGGLLWLAMLMRPKRPYYFGKKSLNPSVCSEFPAAMLGFKDAYRTIPIELTQYLEKTTHARKIDLNGILNSKL